MTWEKLLLMLMERAWLVFEVPILIVLLTLFVAYPGFDESMRIAARGFLPLALGIFWVAAVHNIIVARWLATPDAATLHRIPPWWIPALFFGLRLLFLAIYSGWLISARVGG